MKPKASTAIAAFLVIFAAASAPGVRAQQETTTDIGTLDRASAEKAFKQRPYSPYAGRNFPARPLFGDTHLHTSFSMDAGAFGARLGPKEAYRFAKGEEVTASSGQPARLSRPRDSRVYDRDDGRILVPAEDGALVLKLRRAKCI
jgi:hypothetical protein